MPAWLVPVLAKLLDVIVALAPVLGPMVGAWYFTKYKVGKKKLADAINDLKAPKFIKELLLQVDDIAEKVVKVIWADYVQRLKEGRADGKLTASEIRIANDMALAKFFELAPSALVEALKKLFTPEKLSEIVIDIIKAKVESVKVEAKAAKTGAVLPKKVVSEVNIGPFKFAPPDSKDIKF